MSSTARTVYEGTKDRVVARQQGRAERVVLLRPAFPLQG